MLLQWALAELRATTAVQGMREPNPDAVDYYSRIGASPDADLETIQRRRKQADRRFSPMSASPDGDEKRHMQINEASKVLEDPDERPRYDDLYDALGPINGTIAYQTLPASVVDAVRDEEPLCDHLRGFLEILGPKVGAREFQRYHDELSTPLPEDIGDTDLPKGYAVDDVGFGIAAWSWYQSDQPCAFSLWLTGGRQLWRTALLDPETIDDQLASLRNNGPASVPDTDADDEDETAATTKITLGHPSSAESSMPSGFGTREDESSRLESLAAALSTPAERVLAVLSYIGSTAVWTGGSLGGTLGGGVVGTLLVGIVFVPLLAVALLVQSSLGGVGASGVPLAALDAPLATESLLHYLTIGLLIAVPAWVTGGTVIPWLHDRKASRLPRDAWLVFGVILPALAAALFVGVGQSALAQQLGIGVTAVLTAFTFQAAMDVGAPRVLSLLCRSVATIAFGVAGSVVALATVGLGLEAVEPAVFDTYATLLVDLPLIETPLYGTENARLLVVAAGALALVPLVLTTLYSLAYAVESAALRLRSRAYS